MSECKKKSISIECCGFVALAVMILVSLGAAAQAEDAPWDEGLLVLSARHIGMTGEEIAESGRVEEQALTADAPAENEWRSVPDEAAAVACTPLPDSNRSGLDFEGCVESAIRGGNGFGESSRVCRTLFPERDVAALTAAVAPPEADPIPEVAEVAEVAEVTEVTEAVEDEGDEASADPEVGESAGE